MSVDEAAIWQQTYQVIDKETGSSSYGQSVTYGRQLAKSLTAPFGQYSEYARRLRMVESVAVFDLGRRILVIGGGFGYLEHVMRGRGYIDVRTLDNSQWIADHWMNEAEADCTLIQRDVLGDVSDLSFDAIITEDMASVVDERDLPLFFSNCDLIAPVVIHLVTAITDPAARTWYTMETLAWWKQQSPSHLWINLVSGESL